MRRELRVLCAGLAVWVLRAFPGFLEAASLIAPPGSPGMTEGAGGAARLPASSSRSRRGSRKGNGGKFVTSVSSSRREETDIGL